MNQYRKSPEFQTLEKQLVAISEMYKETMNQIKSQFPLPQPYYWGISLQNKLCPWYGDEPEGDE